MSDNERRFRKLAAEGNIKAIRRRCQQLRDEIEDGLVLHASFEIEDAGEALYRKLAEAEARAERLREAIISEHEKWEAWVAEITGQQGKVDTSRAGTIALIRASQSHLHDDDLDAHDN